MKTILSFRQNEQIRDLMAGTGFLPELAAVETKLRAILSENCGAVKEVSQYLLEAGGKRIRPMLACLSGRLLNADFEDVVTCASAIELIHMASLVHDDIIDNADTRRGLPSINARWGNHVAVLTGDFLFARAFRLLSSARLLPVLELVVDAIEAMCDGEIEQSLARGKCIQSEALYLERIEKKTGKLIVASCSVGPLLAGSEPIKLFSLQNYGRWLGYAFQIIDDILDLKGDSKTLGKPTGLDLSQGYFTLPLIKLVHHPQYGSRTGELLDRLPGDPAALQELTSLLEDSGAIHAAQEEAKMFVEAAKEQLGVFPSSNATKMLASIADYVLERMH
ncbi:MAG TPA: polyprenyl synthetase family protein [Clostridia bacterium]|nr:polyprenyl synthetase family protein [Clostridia bacterium]